MRGGGQITRRKPVASATSLSTACTITSWRCGLTSVIPPPRLQHAAVLTWVECWMSVAHFQTGATWSRHGRPWGGMAGHGVEALGEATHWYSCPRPVLKREAVPALPANAVEGWLSQTPLDLETPASHSACMHPLETREPSHSHCLMGVPPTKTAGRESRRVGHQRGSWSVTDNPVLRRWIAVPT